MTDPTSSPISLTFVPQLSLPKTPSAKKSPSLSPQSARPHTTMKPSYTPLSPSVWHTPVATVAAPPPQTRPFSSDEDATAKDGQLVDVRTPEQFDDILATHSLVCVDFMALWCRKCKYLLPRMRKLAVAHPSVLFCTVDVNSVAKLPKRFEIAKMPTFILLRNGEIVQTLIGGASPEKVAQQLGDIVKKYVASSSETN